MDHKTAQNLSEKLQIAPEQIVREEYELLFLKDLFGSSFGGSLVFKGGTALRLAHGSPRFSDDLDFSIIEQINPKQFIKVIKNMGARYPNVKLADVRKKKNTLFALFKIKEAFLTLAFSIKIKISTRIVDWKKEKDYLVKTFSSPTTSIVVIGNTVTLLRIKKDKEQALKTRKKARDLYDLWYLKARLNQELGLLKHNLSLKELKRELNRVLPKNERYVVEKLFSQK